MSSRVDETANIDSNMHSRNYFLKQVREGCLIREAYLQKLWKVCQNNSVILLRKFSLHSIANRCKNIWILNSNFDGMLGSPYSRN